MAARRRQIFIVFNNKYYYRFNAFVTKCNSGLPYEVV